MEVKDTKLGIFGVHAFTAKDLSEVFNNLHVDDRMSFDACCTCVAPLVKYQHGTALLYAMPPEDPQVEVERTKVSYEHFIPLKFLDWSYMTSDNKESES